MRWLFAMERWPGIIVLASLLLYACAGSIPKEYTVAPDPPFEADEAIVVECSDELVKNAVLGLLKRTYWDEFHIRVTLAKVNREIARKSETNRHHIFAVGVLSSGHREINLDRVSFGRLMGYNDVFGFGDSYEECAERIANMVLMNTRRIPLTRYAPSDWSQRAILEAREAAKEAKKREAREAKEREWQERLQALKNEKKTKEQSLAAENQRELAAALQAPRGEFETTAEYKARMERAKTQKQEIEQRYAAKLKAEQERIDQEIEQFLASTAEAVTLSVEDIGAYDADQGRFSVKIQGQTNQVSVPREAARRFKENRDQLVIKGEKRLTEDGERSYYNIVIEDPTTSNRYAWGLQTERRPEVTKKITPPELTAHVDFAEPSGNGALDAEEEGTVVLTVENRGQGSAYALIAGLSPQTSMRHITYDRERIIQEIRPGTRETAKLSLQADSDVATGQYSFVLTMKEANGFEPEPIPFSIQTRRLIPPDLQVVDVGVTDASQNGKIEPGELASITARVQNRGKGEAKAVKAEVVLGENVFFTAESQRRFDLGNIPPGAYKDVVFALYTNNRIKDNIPASLRLTELRDRFSKREELALYVNRVQKRPEEIVFAGRREPEVEIEDVATLSVDIEQDLPQTGMSNPDAIAVVIGNRNYLKAKNVDFAIRDAQTIREYLMKTFGYKEGNVFFLADATKADFELYFGAKGNPKGKLFNTVKAGRSDVFVYYSGHGAPGLKDHKGYFVPVDSDPQYVEINGYSVDVFYQNLSQIPARSITVVLDACFSGATIFENISPVVITIESPILLMENGVVFSSSKEDQVSSWYNEKKHGMFTYFFLKAIHDRNADRDRDGQLTVQEIYDYLSDDTEGVPYYARRIHGVEQTPQVIGRHKERVLVRY